MVCYKFFKRFFHFGLKNKYKFLIIGFVFAFVLFMGLSSFGFCSSDDDSTPVDMTIVESMSMASDQIVEGDSYISFAHLYRGHKYTVVNTSSSTNKYYAFADEEPYVGMSIDRISVYPNHSSTFTATRDMVLIGNNGNIELYDRTPGMSGTIASLTWFFNSDNIFDVFVSALPFVLVVVVFAFGWFIIHNGIKKSSKGKAGI